MSSFFRSRKPKTSSSREKKSQVSGDGSQSALGEKKESSDTGFSLFSGMTLTASPGMSVSEDESLMGNTDVLPVTEKQSNLEETTTENTQDFAVVLDRPEMELLPEPIQPLPIPQQVRQSAAKKKRTRHVVRPGYARPTDSKGAQGGQSAVVVEEKVCDSAEQEIAEAHTDASTAEIDATPEEPTPEPPTPLYSIGTPSSSDENLFEAVKAQTDDSTPVEISSEAALQDDVDLKIITQSQGDKELDNDLTDSSKSSHLETASELTKLHKSFDVSMPQAAEETNDILESLKGLNPMENLPEIPNIKMDDSFTLGSAVNRLNEQLDQNEEHKLKQLINDLHSATDLEGHIPDMSQGSLHPMTGASEKLNIAMQHLKSQLKILSEDKRSLDYLEEELLQLYTESSNTQNEKEQQFKELQLEESQALASDNYDLAEEISDRMEQLKADLECARYRLPAQDGKVEKALKLRAEISEKEAEIYRQSQATLQEVRQEQQECLDNHRETNTAWSTREKHRLNSDRQRLERTMDHLKLDKEHMEAENMELSNEILQKTEEFQTRKEELMLERGMLQGEISALEAKLAKLKAKEAEFTNTIKEEENKIESVKTEFSPQQEALDKQQQEIEKRENLLQEEFELLSSRQKEFDDKTEENCKKEQEFTDILSSASGELEKSKQTIKRLQEEQQSAREFLNMKHFTFDTDSKLASLYVEQKEVSQQIKNLSNRIQLGQRSVVTLRKTLNEVESQIFDLDAAKEIAKQERNFKEAKRLKEEREALTQEGIGSQGKLESLQKELAEDKKLLEKAQQESTDLDVEIGEKNRLAAVVTVDKASVVIQVIQDQKNRLGDDSLVRALLEAEAKTCRNLVSDLCKKHDIPIPDLDHSQVRPQIQDIKENTEAAGDPAEGKTSQEQTEDYEKLLDKLSELEGRLEAVVEVEDFDEAELQQEITKLKEVMEQTKPSHVDPKGHSLESST